MERILRMKMQKLKSPLTNKGRSRAQTFAHTTY